jgi:hypothetical protein
MFICYIVNNFFFVFLFSRMSPLINTMVGGGSSLTASDQHVNNLVNRIRTIQQEFAANPSSSSSRSISSFGDFRSFDPTNDRDV